MKRKIWLILFVAAILAMLLPSLAPSSSEAAVDPYYGYTTYIVKHGDTLASISRQFCTSWQEIYYLNRQIIGPDPNHLVAGMALIVPLGCTGGGGGCANVYDRGWLPHAQGSVSPPNRYWVIRGDTWYSIGKRFGVSVQALRRANGLQYPYAYRWVVIPCLNVGPVYPVPPVYPPQPIPPQPIPPQPVLSYITISSPLANAVLPATFTVSGTGGNLPEGNVVVRARLLDGSILAERATVLQGPNVGTGGEGSWSVQLSVNAPAGAAGVIEAYSPGTSAFASVNVFFGNSGNVDYPPGQCQVHVKANSPAYDQPEGQVKGVFPSPVSLEAQRKERVNNVDWYQVSVTIDGVLTPIWLPVSSLDSVGSGCN